MAAKKKTVKAKARPAGVPAFPVGARVQVLTGDYANARGEVVEVACTVGSVAVRLDQQPRGVAVHFHADNLKALPVAPVRR